MYVLLDLLRFINVTDFKPKKAWAGFLVPKCTADMTPIQFRPHLSFGSVHSLDVSFLGLAPMSLSVTFCEAGKTPLPPEFLLPFLQTLLWLSSHCSVVLVPISR